MNIEYNKLLEPIKQYITGAYVDENILIDISVVLAKMEHMRRGGVGAVPISKIFNYDVDNLSVKRELIEMFHSFNRTFLPMIKKESIVVYNPHFGIGSRIVGGADADIYIDGVLYDFKTNIKNGWNSADATQVIGYYLLDAIAKKCNDKRNQLDGYPIEKIALYKVRYEEIVYFDVKGMQKDIIEKVIKEICCIYLMYNLNLFIPYNCSDEYIEKYKIPLTKEELLDYCTDGQAEELEWYISDGDKISGFLEKRMKKILEKQNILKEYLNNVDVERLLDKLLHE